MSVHVMAGERRVGMGVGTLTILGLGSCVAVVLYDEASRVGGLAHVLLPDPSYSRDSDRRGRYASTAIPALLEEVVVAGAARTRVTARLVGGACMFQELLPADQPHLGARNVDAARVALTRDGISIVAEDVGGDFGRSIHFDLADGRLRVSSQARGQIEI
jgi:chemotaxis protein CheD